MDTTTVDTGQRFVISIDYGTTYTGVAWVLRTSRDQKVKLSDIKVVTHWPTKIGQKVPSRITYTAHQGENWGYGIEKEALVIQWTKMELEKPDLVDSLHALSRTINQFTDMGFNNENVIKMKIPRHVTKSSVDIISDYLREVATFVRSDIESKTEKDTLKQFPIDLIITHPAEWDVKARNATFKAACQSFSAVFYEAEDKGGQIRLATEPEACARYTMKYAQTNGSLNHLIPGECFIVVDAGGGTVDLVSYRVDQVAPDFRVSKITDVSGGRYGATLVDRSFLEWFLPQCLAPDSNIGNMHQGAHMVLDEKTQVLLEKFEIIKHQFEGLPSPTQDPKRGMIILPGELRLRDGTGRESTDGCLDIYANDLLEMFRWSVEGTIFLINQQLSKIDSNGYRTKTIFLSGGFAMSPHLFKEIRKLALKWGLQLLRGDSCWSAVAQGAVLMALGVDCEPPLPCIPCPFYVGVIVSQRLNGWDHNAAQTYTDNFDRMEYARDNIKWMVSRGDLVSQADGLYAQAELVKKMRIEGSRTGTVTVVFSSSRNPLGPSTQYGDTDGTRKTRNVDYDLAHVPGDTQGKVFKSVNIPRNRERYCEVHMLLEIRISMQTVTLELSDGLHIGGYLVAQLSSIMETTPVQESIPYKAAYC